uniref:Uncharacterized protein n=1 Tax=Tetranychus urticae TaxID=32264 RepID=T1KRB8_TETUR
MLTYQCSYFVQSQTSCTPIAVQYIVYEGNRGLIILVGKTTASSSNQAYLITKPVDFFHPFRYKSTYKGQNVPFEGFIPDVNVAFYLSNNGYWGFKSFSQIKHWTSFADLTAEPILLTQPDSTPVAQFNPSNQYNGAIFKATFTVPYKGNYSYCASMIQDGKPLLKCFDPKGATVHQSNVGPIDAIDLFEWDGDNLLGVYFQNFVTSPVGNKFYWYRFFRIKHEKKYILLSLFVVIQSRWTMVS